MKQHRNTILTDIAAICIHLAVGGLSAWANAGNFDTSLFCQPFLAPPAWIFPIAWTLLYVLMGISAARVLRSDCMERSDALFLNGVQLVVNFLWTVFFFSFDALLLCLFWLVFLILLVILMTVRYAHCDTMAAKLQIPYLIWLGFAAYLNIALWYLNR